MELNFVQSSEVFGKNTLAWETEFKIMGDFNLHIERKKGGDILLYQRTSGSGYAIVEEFRGMDGKPAIDFDIVCLVPKFVKIVSESKPTYASITTTDGEFTEIKSQSKEIEVTSNGTINVTPDAGFSYLNSVKVNTNVAQSGGGGGSSDSDGWVYFDLRNSEYRQDFLLLTQFCPVSVCGLVEYVGDVLYGSTIENYNNNNNEEQRVNNLYGMAMYLGGIIKSGDRQLTYGEFINVVASQTGITNPLDKVPRITKEEFYNLNA